MRSFLEDMHIKGRTVSLPNYSLSVVQLVKNLVRTVLIS